MAAGWHANVRESELLPLFRATGGGMPVNEAVAFADGALARDVECQDREADSSESGGERRAVLAGLAWRPALAGLDRSWDFRRRGPADRNPVDRPRHHQAQAGGGSA